MMMAGEDGMVHLAVKIRGETDDGQQLKTFTAGRERRRRVELLSNAVRASCLALSEECPAPRALGSTLRRASATDLL